MKLKIVVCILVHHLQTRAYLLTYLLTHLPTGKMARVRRLPVRFTGHVHGLDFHVGHTYGEASHLLAQVPYLPSTYQSGPNFEWIYKIL